MKKNTMLMVGAAAVVGYFLYKKMQTKPVVIVQAAPAAALPSGQITPSQILSAATDITSQLISGTLG